MIDLSIIIVSYNTKDILIDCLRSVYGSKTNFSYEVIVVDNNSSDGSAAAVREKFPKVQVLARNINDGFAAANNRGASVAAGRYVWLLNSDTVLFEDTIEKFLNNVIKQDSWIASCQLLNKDESIQSQGGALPNWLNIATWMLNLDGIRLIRRMIPSYQQASDLPAQAGIRHQTSDKKNKAAVCSLQSEFLCTMGWVGGTAMLVRRDLYEAMGGLDEKIFMYGEDVEFCLRANKQNIPVHLFPQARLIHLGQQSGSKEKSIIGEYKGLSYIMRKHGNVIDRIYLRLMLKTGSFLRIIASTLLNKQEMRNTYVKAFKVV